ncbi:transmembrane protein 208-like [Scleropages formosus]|uniref:Transmembrane protein 208 n=1 Tax=Scleropages formosus TaxID=113540 RepID=A0A0P7UJE6_SCLFO|nr:transmembrane protein 208-like [Scleropages formosus]KPP61408.1 transmembrane protein 208-like [Scleropages formosus]
MEASANVKKQICEANRTTLKTCMRLIVSVNAVFAVMNILIFYNSFNFYTCLMLVFSTTVYVGSYRSMSVMAEPVFGDDGSLVDCGVDLNKKYGTAALLKDVILLTAIIQVLSTISSSFWYLWLFVPVRVLFIFWMMSFSPWLVEDAPEYTWEENEKKLA